MRYDGGQGKCGSIGVKGVETRPPLPPLNNARFRFNSTPHSKFVHTCRCREGENERVTATHHCCLFSWVFMSALPSIGAFEIVTAAVVRTVTKTEDRISLSCSGGEFL